MKSSCKLRIVNALIVGIVIFIILCAIRKFIYNSTDWLSHSLIWSSAWALGHFVSRTLTNIKDSIWKILSYDVIAILIASILVTFVLGIVFKVSNCLEHIHTIMTAFGVSVIINNEWRSKLLDMEEY